ncbi:lipoprotein [Leptotrichia sp. OH3620_COT-345]|uniref:lipoprotein n=1 Tax=Leptotrichia sp. OH3620_COT-345 TaxID=2491048 RepID=UPI000F6521A1|nr:lipoprotein [Leptotrichia sp. OH3620_COT-345]RRD38429.1 lipoprotein [Leptotrichia sp. OH3620_COT-345]
MRNRKNWLIFFFLILIFVSCEKKMDKEMENKLKNEEKSVQSKIFTDKSVEKVIQEFEMNSKKRKISIQKFEKLTFENKNYYHSKINIKRNSAYTINYDGIDVTSLVVKIGVVTGTDLGTIEDLVINLIEVSDGNITEEEARGLYAEILARMEENTLSSELVYKNSIKYGITISKETGELIFVAQQHL